MELIHKKTLEQAIKMLDAIGCAYAIKDTDGNMHGTLDVPNRRPLKHPFGSISAHIRKYIDGIEPGQVAHIPCEGFGRQTISTSLTAIMIDRYGKGNFKTAYDKETDAIDAIRF